MGIFDKKQYLTGAELRELFRKIPSRYLTREQRAELGKEFSREHGRIITKSEFRRKLLKLRGEEFRAKTSAEKREFNRKIRYLKKLEGI